MAGTTDAIPQPVSSGALDHADVPQSGVPATPQAPPAPEGFSDLPQGPPPVPEGFGDTPTQPQAQAPAGQPPVQSQQPGIAQRAVQGVASVGNKIGQFGKTEMHDIADAADATAGLVNQVGDYAIGGKASDPNARAEYKAQGEDLQKRSEDFKKQTWDEAKEHIAKGDIRAGLGALVSLFKDAPVDTNDPLVQMANGVLKGSSDSKKLMIEAAKKGDHLAAAQHLGGIVPFVSSVDQAMMNMQKDPSVENLAHLVTSAVPFLIPSLMHGSKGMEGSVETEKTAQAAPQAAAAAAPAEAAEAAPQAVEPGLVKPGTEVVGGEQIPVRAKGKVADIAESSMSKAQKERLQQMEVTQTQPAVRRAAANVAADAADLDQAASSATKEDPLGFNGTAKKLQGKFGPVFKRVDEFSDGAFSKAQADADKYRGTIDKAGRDAYAEAIAKQEMIFDSIKGLAGKGETPDLTTESLQQAKDGWRKSIGMQELAERFNRTLHPTPVGMAEAGDAGYIKPQAFREAIVDGIQQGEFKKAGFTPEHVNDIEKLGNILGKQEVKFTDSLSLLRRSIAEKAVEGGAGFLFGGPVGAAVGIAGAHVAKWTMGEILSRIMSSPVATRTLAEGLKGGWSAAAIANRLKNLAMSEAGELVIPGTGKMNAGESEGLGGAQYADDLAAAVNQGKRDKVGVNASGESAASQEAINRSASEKSQGVKRVAVDTRTGNEKPLIGPDAVDYKAQPYESVEFRGGNRDGEVIDKGDKARQYTRKPDQAEAFHDVEAQPAKLSAPADRAPGFRVSQRVPTAVKSEEDAVNGNLIIGKEAYDRAEANKPGFKRDLAERVSEYPGVPITPEEAVADPEKALQKFTNHMANNLVWLHNQIPSEIRNISKLWYDSAHELTKTWAKKYGIAHEQMAGMVAALSPQNEWNNNVEVAKRVADIYRNKQNFAWSPEMETNSARILAKNPGLAELNDSVRGKKLSQLSEPEEKGWWIRLYDEAHNPRSHANYAPDGSIRGIARTPVGNQPTQTKWSSNSAIGKAVSIMEDGSKENIHKMLGDQHKIRNFYNNMIDPWSTHGDITIDTHAVAAGHLRPMGGSTEEVAHNFGSNVKGKPGVPSSAIAGSNGTYGLYADAYRQAAKKLGILPRELQSITWEGIRSLYESRAKTDALKSQIAQIWKDHKNGELTIDRARKQILKAAGGFKPPKWMADLGQNGEAGVAANEGAVSSPRPSGAGAEAEPRGGSKPSAAAKK